MNNISKSGAIVTIIGGAIMVLIGFLMLLGTSAVLAVSKQNNSVLVLLTIIVLGMGVTNIVLSALCLKSKKDNIRIAAGIIAIVSLLFAWIALFFPAVVVLIGGILLLCGKNQDKITEVQNSIINTASVTDIFNNKTIESDNFE